MNAKKFSCDSCRYGFHGPDCQGLIRSSDGDAYMCECDCLPFDEDARARTLAEDRFDAAFLLPLTGLLVAVAAIVALAG